MNILVKKTRKSVKNHDDETILRLWLCKIDRLSHGTEFHFHNNFSFYNFFFPFNLNFLFLRIFLHKWCWMLYTNWLKNFSIKYLEKRKNKILIHFSSLSFLIWTSKKKKLRVFLWFSHQFFFIFLHLEMLLKSYLVSLFFFNNIFFVNANLTKKLNFKEKLKIFLESFFLFFCYIFSKFLNICWVGERIIIKKNILYIWNFLYTYIHPHDTNTLIEMNIYTQFYFWWKTSSKKKRIIFLFFPFLFFFYSKTHFILLFLVFSFFIKLKLLSLFFHFVFFYFSLIISYLFYNENCAMKKLFEEKLKEILNECFFEDHLLCWLHISAWF